MRLTGIMVLALALSATACGKKEDKSATKSSAKPEKPTNTCLVEIQKAPKPTDRIKVNGVSPDKLAAIKDAWAKAAKAALPADKANLKDKAKWKQSINMVTASMTDNKTHKKTTTMNANLTLTRVLPTFKGHAGANNTDKACKLAQDKACKAAGAKPGCVKSGEYKQMMLKGGTTP